MAYWAGPAAVIENVLRPSVLPGIVTRIRPMSDDELAMDIIDALDAAGFEVVQKESRCGGRIVSASLKERAVHKLQYPIVAARRQAYDTLLWQTPALAIAAQGFLLTAAIDPDTRPLLSFALSFAAFLVAFAALQFFQRLRYAEVQDLKLLQEFELSHKKEGFSVVHGHKTLNDVPPRGLARLGAYRVWKLAPNLFSGPCVVLGNIDIRQPHRRVRRGVWYGFRKFKLRHYQGNEAASRPPAGLDTRRAPR